jgi:hypothetical protein
MVATSNWRLLHHLHCGRRSVAIISVGHRATSTTITRNIKCISRRARNAVAYSVASP